MQQYFADEFVSVIDSLCFRDCHRAIQEVMETHSSAPTPYTPPLQIILLRGLQASADVDQRVKQTAREITKDLFLLLRRETSLCRDLDERAQRLGVLLYLKPEQFEIANEFSQAIRVFGSSSIPGVLGRLNDYCQSFLAYAPFGRTPQHHYQFGSEVMLDSRQFQFRICSALARQKLDYTSSYSSIEPVSILVGDSTVDAVAFHPKRRYEVCVSIPGISLHLFTESLFADLVKELSGQLRCPPRLMNLDFCLGYGDVTRILNSPNSDMIDEYPGIIARVAGIAREGGVSTAFAPTFSPVNERLLEYPSVFGIFTRNLAARDSLARLRQLVRSKLSPSAIREPFQRIFADGRDWWDSEYLIHKHEIHVRLDHQLAEHLPID